MLSRDSKIISSGLLLIKGTRKWSRTQRALPRAMLTNWWYKTLLQVQGSLETNKKIVNTILEFESTPGSYRFSLWSRIIKNGPKRQPLVNRAPGSPITDLSVRRSSLKPQKKNLADAVSFTTRKDVVRAFFFDFVWHHVRVLQLWTLMGLATMATMLRSNVATRWTYTWMQKSCWVYWSLGW